MYLLMGKGILFHSELMLSDIKFRVSVEKCIVHWITQDLVMVLFFYFACLKHIIHFFRSFL